MAQKIKSTKTEQNDADFVRMYYEHQYDTMTKHEDNRLAMTNYVLTVSALAFTFGYQNAAQISIITGIGLPTIIILVNIFAILYIERTADFMKVHQDRARAILEIYAPELKKINEKLTWRKGNFLRTKRGMQKGIHFLLILVALIPVAVYLLQFI
ncbi:MAG: hypothetical protein JW963_01935 [Anaerolineales bacterium]|nr:hypothetical protein [Anaerolineales bacterium]